jgi:hypothetical protein
VYPPSPSLVSINFKKGGERNGSAGRGISE